MGCIILYKNLALQKYFHLKDSSLLVYFEMVFSDDRMLKFLELGSLHHFYHCHIPWVPVIKVKGGFIYFSNE